MTLIRKTPVKGRIATLVLLIIAGCAVGPNFKRPADPKVPGYTPAPPSTTSSTPNVSGGEAQRFVQGQDIPGEWWTLFHSKPLNDLIERSLKNNPDLKAAQGALLVAKVTLDLTTRQMQVGYVSYLALLSAEQTYQQALINLVQAQSNRYADTAALFHALGGGWWNRPDVPRGLKRLAPSLCRDNRGASLSQMQVQVLPGPPLQHQDRAERKKRLSSIN